MSFFSGPRIKAMLLDSSYESAGQLREKLREADIDVVEWSTSGAGWIAAWQKAKPDIVMIDLQLPKRDGLYCIEKLMTLDPNAVVIFTHSYDGMMANEVEAKALQVGASSVLQKPYSDKRLRVSLERGFELVAQKRRNVMIKPSSG